jgi:hypothetical protein
MSPQTEPTSACNNKWSAKKNLGVRSMAVTAKKKAKKTAKSTTLQPLGERIVV